MIYAWHTQGRLVAPYTGSAQVRLIKQMIGIDRHESGTFIYVTPAPRYQQCPDHAVIMLRNMGWTIIRVEKNG